MSIQTTDFAITVSICDFITWHGEGDTDYVGNISLIRALRILGIPVDPAKLYEMNFEPPTAGFWNVLLYKGLANEENIFAIDMYRDDYDQLDIVKFGIHAAENANEVRTELRAFFDSSKYQCHYEEGGHLTSVASMLDGSLYPKKMANGNFMQHLVIMYEADS